MTVSRAVVREDNRLEREAEGSQIALAYHRWHWTMDETNRKRVSVREYALAVARNSTRIGRMATGYAAWVKNGSPADQLGNEIERAAYRGDRLAAMEAVAEAKGVSIGTARRHHFEEVREVQAVAAERADERNTSFSEEVAEVAQQREQFRRGGAAAKADTTVKRHFAYLRIEGEVARATKALRDAMTYADTRDFDAEEAELLAESISRLTSTARLLSLKITGTSGVDWDGELAKLGGTS